MRYTISFFNKDMKLLDTINKTRGFVDAIKRGIVKKSNRNFGNYTIEYKDTINQNKEYTMEDNNGETYYIWLTLIKRKGEHYGR